MTNEEILMLIVFAAGLILLLVAAFKKHAGPLKKVNPIVAGALGVLLVIPGFVWGVMPFLPEVAPQQVIVTTPTTTAAVPTFTIEPVKNTTGFNLNSTLNVGKTEFTWPWAVSAADNTGDRTGTTDLVPARATFLVRPVAPVGSDTTTLATIFYSVTPSNFETQTDRWLFIRDTYSKQAMLNFSAQVRGTSGTTTTFESGSLSLTLTQTGEIWFDALLSNTTVAKYWSTLSSLKLTVTFRNADYSWSASYPITLIKISDACANT